MAEQWIEAAVAHRLAVFAGGSVAGPRSLCARAFAGLIRARALVLKSPALAQENVDIPPAFWLDDSLNKPVRSWEVGDFSYWDQRGDRWQAFGVTFALGEVLEMLPFEQRAATARGLSVAGNPAWVPARVARQFAWEKAEATPTKAHLAVLDQARLGFVTGRAVLAQCISTYKHGRPPPWDDPADWEEPEWDIADWFWRDFKVTQRASFDWERGIFWGEGPWGRGKGLMKLEGAHFLAESLQALLPSHLRGAPVETGAKGQGKRGGQPPRAFWDEMLCDIRALIHQGDFKPERQADVEKAMLTWAEGKDEKLSEATARPKARLLFERYKNEAENFLAS